MTLSNEAVSFVWQLLVAGAISRESAHNLMRPWVESGWPCEVGALSGAQSLHGLDMSAHPAAPHLARHGPLEPDRVWLVSDDELEALARDWFRATGADSKVQWTPGAVKFVVASAHDGRVSRPEARRILGDSPRAEAEISELVAVGLAILSDIEE